MSAPTIQGILHKPGAPVFFNPAMMVPNTFEIDVAGDVLADLQRHTDALRAMEEPRAIYALDGGLRLYNERPRKWRSDICWLSHADEASYYWFEDIYRRLGLGAMVAPFVPHDREIRLYAGFFVTRSRCEALDMHCDWLTEGNDAFTLMAAITPNASGLGMTYETARNEMRDHTYEVGKGLVFGTHFRHSTSIGQLDERAIFLCLNFGTDRMENWPNIARTTATQGDFFRQPDGSFITYADLQAQLGKAGAALNAGY